MSAVVTEVLYNCTQPGCGAGFVGAFTVSRFLKLPLNLDPTLNIPLSPLVQKRQRRAMESESAEHAPGTGGEIHAAGISGSAEGGRQCCNEAKPSSQAGADTGLPTPDAAKLLQQPEAIPAAAPAPAEASSGLGHWHHLF